MISFRKIGPSEWGIQSDDSLTVGAVVNVALRSGDTKPVVVGPARGTQYGKFVYESCSVKQNQQATTQVGDLSGILALFAKAKQHLKFPAIVLGVPALGNEFTIRINVAGDRAKIPGSLTVLEADRNGDGERAWLGRVLLDGTFQPSAAGSKPAIAARLSAFAADPSNIAGADGRLHGRCCFCRKALTDERSTAAGYGKKCAQNFGLAWGARPEEFAAQAA